MPARDPVPLLHPRVRVHVGSQELWTIWFGNGASALIEIDPSDRSAWPSSAHRWRVDGFGISAEGVSYSRDVAVRAAWCRAAQLSLPPPLDVDALELAREVDRAEPTEAAAVIRELLELRTGRAWSVRIGRGSRRAELHVTLHAPRNGNTWAMSAGEAALLAAVLGVDYVGPMGHTVGAKLGARARAVLAICGRSAGPRDQAAIAFVH